MKTRSQILELAARRDYDLAVIGGGILGAGVAQDAASRGLSVLLLEKDDFAGGASGESAKLIQGGLNRLAEGRLRLAQEMIVEQSLLEQLAPHLVREQNFVLPLSKDQMPLALKTGLCLCIHDCLSIGKHPSKQRSRRLNKKMVLEAAPALANSRIFGGRQFTDAITDDARLVLELLKSACTSGAHVLNYMEAARIEVEETRIAKIICRDRYSGREVSFSCQAVINAAGVGSDQVSQLIDPNWPARIQVVRAVRFMLPASAYETNFALCLPAPNGEPLFIIPWQRALIVGTTLAITPADSPAFVSNEIRSMLAILNEHNAHRQVQDSDVIATWVEERVDMNKLQVLPAASGKDESAKLFGLLSLGKLKLPNFKADKPFVFDGPAGSVSVVSDTLTNYRLLAEQAVDRLLSRNPRLVTQQVSGSRTQRIMLGGWLDKEDFLTATAIISARARKLGIEPATIDHLITTYGKDAQQVLDLIEEQPYFNQRICPDFPPVLAEIPYCIMNEMAISLEDLLYRRIRLGQLHHQQCLDAAPKVGRMVQEIMGWDNNRVEAELEALTG